MIAMVVQWCDCCTRADIESICAVLQLLLFQIIFYFSEDTCFLQGWIGALWRSLWTWLTATGTSKTLVQPPSANADGTSRGLGFISPQGKLSVFPANAHGQLYAESSTCKVFLWQAHLIQSHESLERILRSYLDGMKRQGLLDRHKDASNKHDSPDQSSHHHHKHRNMHKKTLAQQKTHSSGLDSNFSMLEADRVFGIPSEWNSPPDIENGLGKPQTFTMTTSCCASLHAALTLLRTTFSYNLEGKNMVCVSGTMKTQADNLPVSIESLCVALISGAVR